jgi:hypothetical protein
MTERGTPCESSSTVSFSGKRVAAMRARRSSRSASGDLDRERPDRGVARRAFDLDSHVSSLVGRVVW